MAIKRNALGRGLDSLISMDDVPARGASAINEIALSAIVPNPDQPRDLFDEEALAELAASIGQHGVIQPISVRSTPDGNYQIIAGERRYRAAQMAGLTTIPAYVRDVDEVEQTEMALIENIQREDLNAIEVALALTKLMEKHSFTQEKLAERLGKKRTTLANFLRLLKLPAQVQMGLKERRLDVGHARALLSVDNPMLQIRLYEETVKRGLSVRQVEQLAKAWAEEAPDDSAKPAKRGSLNRDYDEIRKKLSGAFQTRVQFACDKNGKGKISFPFANQEELVKLIAIFDKLKSQAAQTDPE